MKQINVVKLIYLLIIKLFRHGNLPVFYNICGFDGTHKIPMQAEGVEVRIADWGEKKLTIW